MPEPARSIRKPPEQVVFNQLELKQSEFPISRFEWNRLARVAYPGQFYASPGSRLTPISREFPCLYIGESQETAVAEIWGDRFYAHRELGHRVYTIPESEAVQWQYLRVKTVPRLKLCDLTDSATLLATGFDAATLYGSDLEIPQGWAEVVARHPAIFDGILYRSRHTHRHCIVAWARRERGLESEFEFEPDGPFLNSAAAYSVAAAMRLALAFVS